MVLLAELRWVTVMLKGVHPACRDAHDVDHRPKDDGDDQYRMTIRV